MYVKLTLEFDNVAEAELIVGIISAVVTEAEGILGELPSEADEADEVVVSSVADTPTEAPPKKRGRPKKPRPEEVKAVEPAPEPEPTPQAEPTPATDLMPDDAPVSKETVLTGQHLQDYVMALIKQQRLEPNLVKKSVFPKFNITRLVDVPTDKVAAVKEAVDMLLKDRTPTNDLDI